MLLGLCIKIDNINHYIKPFVLDNSYKDIFIGQVLRDIDFSLIIQMNDTFEINLIIYPNKYSYYTANRENTEPSFFKILGKYTIVFNKIEHLIEINEYKKGYIIKKLDEVYDLHIEFLVILMENKEDYIISNPYIKGNKKFLEDNFFK
jgi:hypothetical protein